MRPMRRTFELRSARRIDLKPQNLIFFLFLLFYLILPSFLLLFLIPQVKRDKHDFHALV